MRKKVVITGSSGRIGRALHWRLCQDHEVVGIDLAPSSATSMIADIRDHERLQRAFEGAEMVFHCAALHAPHVGLAPEKAFCDINVSATEKVGRAALAAGVSRIVFTSTTALYGYANWGKGEAAWVNEQTLPQPRTIYHRTKLEAESVLRGYVGQGLSVSVIRMSRCFPEPAPRMAVYRLHRGVDYRDVAEAHLLAAQLVEKKTFDIYVVSGTTPFLAEDCPRLYQHPETVIRERYPLLAREFDRRGWKFPEAIDRVYDTSHAERVLGWRSKRGPLDVLRRFDDNDFEVLPPA